MPVLFILSAAVCWGLLGPVSRYALQEGLGAVEIAFWRAAIAAALFSAQAGVEGVQKIRPRDFPWLLLFGGLGVALLEGSNLLAVEKGGASLASILLYTAPAWVALFSVIGLGERMTQQKIVALLLSVGGVAGVALGGSSEHLTFSTEAIFWGLVSGASYASFYIFGKVFFDRYRVSTVFLVVFPTGALLLWPFSDFKAKSTVAWGAVAFLGVASTFLAYLFYSWGLKRMEPTRASILATLEPVVAAMAAYFLWGEKLQGLGYFWAGLVLAGVLLMAREESAPEGLEGKII